MPNSQVTITLGRYGQRVVKEWRDSTGDRDNGPWLSGNKRSVAESFGSSAADYTNGESKRMRGETSSRIYGSRSRASAADSRLCPNDLRLKLMCKRASRVEVNKTVSRRNGRYDNVSEHFRSPEESGDNLLRRGASSVRTTGPPREHSMASSYSWPSSSGVWERSPENAPKLPARMSHLRGASDEFTPFPMARPTDTSRAGNIQFNQPADPYRPKPPIPSTTRIPNDPVRFVREHPSAPSGMNMISPRPAVGTQDNQFLTVASFLSSLGLEKYSINFQAEEIDMAALRQMRDNDLKELSIPMGPRKKILLTLQGPGRRPVPSHPNNPVH